MVSIFVRILKLKYVILHISHTTQIKVKETNQLYRNEKGKREDKVQQPQVFLDHRIQAA